MTDDLRDLLAEVMESVPEKVTGVVIPGCGHFVPEERPEPIADLVLGLTAAAPPADRGAGQS